MSKEKFSNKIVVPIPEEEKSYCKKCDLHLKSSRALVGHLNKVHNLKLEEYLAEQYLDEKPICNSEDCCNETRYLRGKYMFNRYCKEHASEARSEWSKSNATLDYGWKKGLTKEDHVGIASQAEKMKGENNPWYGKEIKHLRDGKNIDSLRKKYKGDFLKECNFYEQKHNIRLLNPENYNNLNENNLEFLCLNCNNKNLTSFYKLKNQKNACLDCWDRSHSEETKIKIRDVFKHNEEEYLKICEQNDSFDVLSVYGDYKNKQHQKLEVQCKVCKDKTTRTLTAIQNQTMCWKCNPRSIEEVKIEKFLNENNIKHERNTREVIIGKELDFFIPQNNFAIEYNGLYWHCENHKDKNYHRTKTDLCREKGIQLFHVFDDEWFDKQEIVKSMILSRLGNSKHKVYARECKVVNVSNNDSKAFFNKTHISGHVNSKHCLGLLYGDKLVCCLSLREPFVGKYKGNIEIARFSSELDTVVVGGLGKLMKKVVAWCEENGYSGVVTYADLRFGLGESYVKVGFSEVGETGLDYWYTDYFERYNRFKFRAQEGLSEKQVAEENGVYRIYGCGSKIYQLAIKQDEV